MNKIIMTFVLVCLASLIAIAIMYGENTGHVTTGTLSAAQEINCGSNTPKLTVNTLGSVSVTPDELILQTSVNANGPDAASALTSDNQLATHLITQLTSEGISKSDIQTSFFNISPTYSFSGVITGYRVSNDISITLRNLNTAGQLIDNAVGTIGSSGTIQSVSFGASNQTQLDGQAKSKAINQAIGEAGEMAAAAGKKLAGICSISDQTQNNFSQPEFAYLSSSTTPIEPGSQNITAEVQVVFELTD
jgi:uncharacterized protein YggE